MDYNKLFIPLSELINEDINKWTFVELDLTYKEICDKGIIIWCDDNVRGKWTQILPSKFAFELYDDSVMFVIKFI